MTSSGSAASEGQKQYEEFMETASILEKVNVPLSVGELHPRGIWAYPGGKTGIIGRT